MCFSMQQPGHGAGEIFSPVAGPAAIRAAAVWPWAAVTAVATASIVPHSWYVTLSAVTAVDKMRCRHSGRVSSCSYYYVLNNTPCSQRVPTVVLAVVPADQKFWIYTVLIYTDLIYTDLAGSTLSRATSAAMRFGL